MQPDVRVVAAQMAGAADQFHLNPFSRQHFRQAIAHFSGRVVADETYGVNGFVGRTRCDDSFDSHSLLGMQEIVYLLENGFRFRHASLAFGLAGKEPLCRFNDMHTIGLQLLQIFLC